MTSSLIRFFFLLLLLNGVFGAHAQNLHLQIEGSSANETAMIDSIGYIKKLANAKSISEEVYQVRQRIERAGYIEAEVLENYKINDSTFRYRFALGPKTKNLHIYIGKNQNLKALAFPAIAADTVRMSLHETETFMNNAMHRLEVKGYSLATLKLTNFRKQGNALFADLEIQEGSQRQLNDIVINGYDKFPPGHKKNIQRLYKGKTFNQQNLAKVHADFQKFRFVTQTKYPEILFSQDTTKVYVYLEKAKPNRFDGFIGFANDEETQKLIFTGYVDLLLVNVMNSGEELTLYWKSDGQEQKTFNVAFELPYIFKTPFGIKAALNIFKQDSTFQNTRTAFDLGYLFDYNTRLYVGYQATESSDIQNTNNFSISDFSNRFYTANFEYAAFRPEDLLFPQQTIASVRTGIGSRESNQNTNSQLFATVNLSHNFYLNQKNVFNIRSQNHYLQSDNYIINELYRFGGINSIRGFNENSLQANMFSSILTEYRYVPAPNIYIHSIVDYGYFRDESSGNGGGLLGIGIGIGLLTKNGLLNLVYANGSTNEQSITFSNSIVHISFKTTF
jgi:hypothetical protein